MKRKFINGSHWDFLDSYSSKYIHIDDINKHPHLIIEYSNIKKSLEKDFSKNRNNYAMGKNPFIEKVIGTAKKELGKV